MELFKPDGHFTGEGLTALVDGNLDELHRLEAAEHLSFCDTCLEKYTALLTGEALIEPPAPLREPVLKRLRQRTTKILFSRYATVAAAAVIAVGIFSGSLMLGRDGRGGNLTNNDYTVSEPAPAPSQGIASTLDSAMDSFTGRVNSFFSGLFAGAVTPTRQPGNAPQQDTPEEDEPETSTNPYEERQQQRDEREQLFQNPAEQ